MGDLVSDDSCDEYFLPLICVRVVLTGSLSTEFAGGELFFHGGLYLDVVDDWDGCNGTSWIPLPLVGGLFLVYLFVRWVLQFLPRDCICIE
jgi:hypothetical protein